MKITLSYHILNVPKDEPDELIINGKVVLFVEGSLIDTTVSSDLRSLEALRHVSVMVTMYNLQGHIIYRNRASETELVMPGNHHFKGTAFKMNSIITYRRTITFRTLRIPWLQTEFLCQIFYALRF